MAEKVTIDISSDSDFDSDSEEVICVARIPGNSSNSLDTSKSSSGKTREERDREAAVFVAAFLRDDYPKRMDSSNSIENSNHRDRLEENDEKIIEPEPSFRSDSVESDSAWSSSVFVPSLSFSQRRNMDTAAAHAHQIEHNHEDEIVDEDKGDLNIESEPPFDDNDECESDEEWNASQRKRLHSSPSRSRAVAHLKKMKSQNNALVVSSKVSSSEWVDRNRMKFACQSVATTSPPPPPSYPGMNGDIINVLSELAEFYKIDVDRKNDFRAMMMGKAIETIKKLEYAITDSDEMESELNKMDHIGKKTAKKTIEILRTGTLKKLTAAKNDGMFATLALFQGIWGVGKITSFRWYKQGYRTLDDIANYATLTPQQQIGLTHYDDIQERMPRLEAKLIVDFVTSQILKFGQERNIELDCEACGSYRRGQELCGDVDVLIKYPDDNVVPAGFLTELLRPLRQCGFLTNDLTEGRDGSYMGVCCLQRIQTLEESVATAAGYEEDGQLQDFSRALVTRNEFRHRRIDIKVYPRSQFPFAILYFTGSGYFNRSMRLFARKKGYSLSDKEIRKIIRYKSPKGTVEKLDAGPPVRCETERDIFDFLGLIYKEPHARSPKAD